MSEGLRPSRLLKLRPISGSRFAPSPSGRGYTSFFVGVDQLLSNVLRRNPVGTGFQRLAHFVEALGAGLFDRVGQLVQFFRLGRQGQRIRASGSLAVFSR